MLSGVLQPFLVLCCHAMFLRCSVCIFRVENQSFGQLLLQLFGWQDLLYPIARYGLGSRVEYQESWGSSSLDPGEIWHLITRLPHWSKCRLLELQRVPPILLPSNFSSYSEDDCHFSLNSFVPQVHSFASFTKSLFPITLFPFFVSLIFLWF